MSKERCYWCGEPAGERTQDILNKDGSDIIEVPICDQCNRDDWELRCAR